MAYKPIREYPKENGMPVIPRDVWNGYPADYKGKISGNIGSLLTMNDKRQTCIMDVKVI